MCSTKRGLRRSRTGKTSCRTRVRKKRGSALDGSVEWGIRWRTRWASMSLRRARSMGRMRSPSEGGSTARPRTPVPRRILIIRVSARSSAWWPVAMRPAPTRAAAERRAIQRAARARACKLPPDATRIFVRSKGMSSDRANASATSSSAAHPSRSPWSTPCANRPNANDFRILASTCRRAIESGPPLTATSTVDPRGSSWCSVRVARTSVMRVGGWERGMARQSQHSSKVLHSSRYLPSKAPRRGAGT